MTRKPTTAIRWTFCALPLLAVGACSGTDCREGNECYSRGKAVIEGKFVAALLQHDADGMREAAREAMPFFDKGCQLDHAASCGAKAMYAEMFGE